MIRKYFCFAVVLLCVAWFADGQADATQKKLGAGAAQKQVDVCKLLTSAEVQAVQGEAVTETKPSPERGNLAMSQCVFRTATPAKSVSVAVAAPAAGKSAGLTPRQLWRQQFAAGAVREEGERHAASKSSKNEAESESSRPRPIRGLGEEAYWVGNPIAGALYVLRGEKFVRISVGGIRKEAERIEKSTALARNVMARLD